MLTFRCLKSCFFVTLLMIIFTSSYAGGCVQWSASVFHPRPNQQGQIAADTGIFWLKSDDLGLTEQAMPAYKMNTDRQQYLQQLKQTGFFNPARPTIIFIHGWQPGSITDTHQSRFDFCYQFKNQLDETSPRYNTLTKWKGWNVGVFYWNQFADESNVLTAEAKIYSTRGKEQMRWAYIDNSGAMQYCTAGQSNCIFPNVDITQMAYQSYQQAFSGLVNFHPTELRIAGQSLGTQIATQLTDRVVHNKTLPQPTRLVLLDPYFSSNGMGVSEDHLPASVADYNADKVADILKTVNKFPVSVYRTSRLSFWPTGDPAVKLTSQVAFLQLYPKFVDHDTPSYQAELHISSIYIYFMSMKSQPIWPVLEHNPSKTLPTAYINAASSNSQVLALMRQQRYQQPSLGEYLFVATQLYKFSNQEPANNS